MRLAGQAHEVFLIASRPNATQSDPALARIPPQEWHDDLDLDADEDERMMHERRRVLRKQEAEIRHAADRLSQENLKLLEEMREHTAEAQRLRIEAEAEEPCRGALRAALRQRRRGVSQAAFHFWRPEFVRNRPRFGRTSSNLGRRRTRSDRFRAKFRRVWPSPVQDRPIPDPVWPHLSPTSVELGPTTIEVGPMFCRFRADSSV